MTTTEPRVTTSPYLSGNFAPVDDELDVADLPVRGRIPEELNGRLLRIGPNPVAAPDPQTYHWFTGSGMVHGVRMRDGKAEWYRNRFVRDDNVTATKGWPTTPGPRHGMGGGTANTNVIGHAGRTLAIVEAGGLPVELTYDLDTVQMTDFGGTLPGSFTAHPKRDPRTGELHAVVYYWEWDYVQYVVVGTDGQRAPYRRHPGARQADVARLLDHRVPSRHPRSARDVRSRCRDERYATLPYSWNPDYGARVGLLPREGDQWRCHALVRGRPLLRVPPDERVRPPRRSRRVRRRAASEDVRHRPQRPERRHTEPRAVDDRSRRRARARRGPRRPGPGVPTARRAARRAPQPLRVRRRVRRERRNTGRRSSTTSTRARPKCTSTARAASRSSRSSSARADDAAEDDGWIMSYVYDATTDSSDIVILHAQDFTGEPVAVDLVAAARAVRLPRQLGARRAVSAHTFVRLPVRPAPPPSTVRSDVRTASAQPKFCVCG